MKHCLVENKIAIMDVGDEVYFIYKNLENKWTYNIEKVISVGESKVATLGFGIQLRKIEELFLSKEEILKEIARRRGNDS